MHFEGHNIIPAFPSASRREGGATSWRRITLHSFLRDSETASKPSLSMTRYVHQCIIMVKILSNSAIACTESVYWKRCKKKCRLVKRSLNHGVPFAQHRSCSDSAGLRSEQQYQLFQASLQVPRGGPTDVAWKSVLNIHGLKQTTIQVSGFFCCFHFGLL